MGACERVDEQPNYAPMTGEDLILIWQKQRDPGAGDELCRRSWPWLVVFFKRFVPFHIAEDLTQETLLKSLSTSGRFQLGKGTYKSWLVTIAAHTLFDYGRKLRARPEFTLDRDDVTDPSPFDQFASEAPSPEKLLANFEFAEALFECVGELEFRHRAVFILHGLGVERHVLAEEFQCSVMAISMVYHHSTTKVAACLKSKGYTFQSGPDPNVVTMVLMRFADEMLIYTKLAQKGAQQ